MNVLCVVPSQPPQNVSVEATSSTVSCPRSNVVVFHKVQYIQEQLWHTGLTTRCKMQGLELALPISCHISSSTQCCNSIITNRNSKLLSISLFYTLCLKKVSTVTLSVTLSNLNRFSKFLHC